MTRDATPSLFSLARRWWQTNVSDTDLPWVIQVFWKLLTVSIIATLVCAVPSAHNPLAPWVMYPLAGFFALMGLFTRLGD